MALPDCADRAPPTNPVAAIDDWWQRNRARVAGMRQGSIEINWSTGDVRFDIKDTERVRLNGVGAQKGP